MTDFSVEYKNLFYFMRMYKNAMIYQRLDRLVGSEMELHVFAYLDDVVVNTLQMVKTSVRLY